MLIPNLSYKVKSLSQMPPQPNLSSKELPNPSKELVFNEQDRLKMKIQELQDSLKLVAAQNNAQQERHNAQMSQKDRIILILQQKIKRKYRYPDQKQQIQNNGMETFEILRNELNRKQSIIRQLEENISLYQINNAQQISYLNSKVNRLQSKICLLYDQNQKTTKKYVEAKIFIDKLEKELFKQKPTCNNLQSQDEVISKCKNARETVDKQIIKVAKEKDDKIKILQKQYAIVLERLKQKQVSEKIWVSKIKQLEQSDISQGDKYAKWEQMKDDLFKLRMKCDHLARKVENRQQYVELLHNKITDYERQITMIKQTNQNIIRSLRNEIIVLRPKAESEMSENKRLKLTIDTIQEIIHKLKLQ